MALRARDFGGFLLSFGVTFSLVFQGVVNIAVVSGTAPTKGISLPFVSYGGSGLALTMAEVGLGRRSLEEMVALLTDPETKLVTSRPAPPEGLFLTRVHYYKTA